MEPVIIVLFLIVLVLLGWKIRQDRKEPLDVDSEKQCLPYLLVVASILLLVALYKYFISTGNVIIPHPITVSMPSGPTFKLPGGTALMFN